MKKHWMRSAKLSALLIFTLSLFSMNLSGQELEVSGTVTDENGETIPGVNVVIQGTTSGAITNLNGVYSISVSGPEAILEFSYVGYKTEAIRVGNQRTIDVTMELEMIGMDEVVIIGYGSMKKSDLTGSVASVRSEALEEISTARIDQALQGRAAGVHVTSTDGEPGAGASILIRGGNSVQASNEPLYVIDGFIGAGDLNQINPNDIESIEILKDASSTAIYGARGANGVILITTKSGSASGKGKISFSSYYGIQQLPRKVDVMGPQDFANFANEYAQSIWNPLPYPDSIVEGGTDWQEAITRNAPIANVQLAFSGGNEKSKYYVSGNYFDQEGIINNSGIKRYSLRANMESKFYKWLHAGANINLSHYNRKPTAVNLDYAVQTVPTMEIYDSNGEYTYLNPVSDEFINHPVSQAELSVRERQRSRMLINLFGNIDIVEGLKLKTTIGADLGFNKNNNYSPGTLPKRKIENSGGNATVSTSHSLVFLTENYLDFNRTFSGIHTFNAVAGFTYQSSVTEGVNANGTKFVNDATLFHNLSLADPESPINISSNYTNWQIVSLFGRINYSLMGKYLVTFSARRDGSSVFGKNNPWAVFPSGAVAWRLSEEDFIKNLGVFSSLKLRTSYGLSGNQAISPYQTLPTLRSEVVIFTNTLDKGFVQGRLPNPNLKWETTAQFDVGLEMGFFRNRLRIETDYYAKKTEDLLLDVEIPWQTGYTKTIANVGSISNKGVELLINAVPVESGDFTWELAFNIASNRNKVLDLGDKDFIFLTRSGGWKTGILRVGEPVGSFYGAEYIGTWKSQEEIDSVGTQVSARPGYPRFADLDTNGVFSGGDDDMTKIGDATPLFFGGIQNTFRYKGLYLSIFFQGSFGNDVANMRNRHMLLGNYSRGVYEELNGRWTVDNPTSDIPVAGSYNYFKQMPSSLWIEDGSYLRLKTLQVGYDLPLRNWNLSWVTRANIYFRGNNLFLWHNYRGFDPEVNVPNSGGNQSVLRGYDDGAYPQNRSFVFGINLEF